MSIPPDASDSQYKKYIATAKNELKKNPDLCAQILANESNTSTAENLWSWLRQTLSATETWPETLQEKLAEIKAAEQLKLEQKRIRVAAEIPATAASLAVISSAVTPVAENQMQLPIAPFNSEAPVAIRTNSPTKSTNPSTDATNDTTLPQASSFAASTLEAAAVVLLTAPIIPKATTTVVPTIETTNKILNTEGTVVLSTNKDNKASNNQTPATVVSSELKPIAPIAPIAENEDQALVGHKNVISSKPSAAATKNVDRANNNTEINSVVAPTRVATASTNQKTDSTPSSVPLVNTVVPEKPFHPDPTGFGLAGIIGAGIGITVLVAAAAAIVAAGVVIASPVIIGALAIGACLTIAGAGFLCLSTYFNNNKSPSANTCTPFRERADSSTTPTTPIVAA